MPTGSAGTGESFSRGFRLLLWPHPGMHVLEASADQGARADAIRAMGAVPLCVRESGTDLAPLRVRGFEVVTLEALGRREGPPLEGAVVSIATGRTRGSEWTTRDAEGLLRVLAATLAPGAALSISLPSPLLGWPLLGQLLARLMDAPDRSSPLRGARGIALLDGKALAASCAQAGLEDVRVFAPFPDAARLKFLVPLASPAAVDYFFRTLVPRARTSARRAAVRLLSWLARRGLLHRLAPGLELTARTRARP